MAMFTNLEADKAYDIIGAATGHWKTQGISGEDAMSIDDWDDGDEAWLAGEEEFAGKPEEVAG